MQPLVLIATALDLCLVIRRTKVHVPTIVFLLIPIGIVPLSLSYGHMSGLSFICLILTDAVGLVYIEKDKKGV